MNYTYRLARRLARLRHAAFPAACGLGSTDRSIRQHYAPRYHLVSKALPVLTLVLLLAACTESSAPLAPAAGATDEIDMSLLRRGWGRKLVRIQIAPDTARVSPGQTTRFTASGVFSDGKSRLITVSWATTGGTIDSTGLFRADSTAGFYQVIGTESFVGLTDTAAVIEVPAPDAPAPEPPAPEPPAPVDTAPPVDEPPPPADEPPPAVASVSVTPSSATLAVGRSVQLTATAKDANGTVVNALPVSWSGSNSAIASVSSSGMVQAVRAGSTTITASVQGVEGKANITVNEPPPTVSSVSVTPSSATLTVGESVQLSATAKDGNGSTMTGLTVSWTTSAPAVASVSSSGVVRGLASGSAVVSAAIDGVQGRTNITVQTPISTGSGACGSYSHDRLVSVSTASQLNTAIANAQSGDLIELAAGTYTGRWTATASGTSTKPIVLCGPRTAVITPANLSTSGFALTLKADYWVLDGFTVTNTQQGIALVGGNRNTIRNLAIHQIGQEAIHLHGFSSHNLIEDNLIHDTGKVTAEWGEGVYVGSWSGHWCTWSNCDPDRSDYNVIRNNVIGPNIGSEMVDMKEGTTGTVLSGNTWNGRGQSAATLNLRSWVTAFGNDASITNNTGSVAVVHGYKIETVSPGWGNGNMFHGNVSDLGGGTGYGFWKGASPSRTVVGCDNSVSNADSGFANVTCTP